MKGFQTQNVVFIDLSYGQQTTFGHVLRKLYTKDNDLMALAPGRAGHPHDGSQHSLYLRGDRKDCTAFLELVRERYKEASPTIALVIDAINAGERYIEATKLGR